MDIKQIAARLRAKVSLETIDFQKDDFGQQIEAIITRITNDIKNGKVKSEKQVSDDGYTTELSDLIFKRLGIQTKIKTDGDLASVLPFYINKNHIFINKFWRGGFTISDQEKILKDAHNRKGTIDLAKAKVGGIYSECKVNVNLNFYCIVTVLNLNPAEITGIVLHELGHAFGVCEYADRLESINIALSNVALAVTGNAGKKATHVYKELKTLKHDITEAEVDELLSGDRVVAGAKWFTLIVGVVKSQLGNDKYDETGFEYLADSFVTRFGYGKHAVIALDKVHKFSGDPAKSVTGNISLQIFSILKLLGALVVIAATFSVWIPFGVYWLLIFSLVFYTTGDGVRPMVYDDLKERYIRVRNNVIERIKNREIETDEVKDLLDQVDTIDAIIKETYDTRIIWNRLSTVVFSVSRQAKSSINQQQLLEELASNELFVQAAKLNMIGNA